MALYNIDEFRDDIRWTFGENSVQMEVFNGMRELTLQQAQIIAAKNDEIEALRAELSECIAGGHDYADDLAGDDDSTAATIAPALVE